MTEFKKLLGIVDEIHSQQQQLKSWATLHCNHENEWSEETLNIEDAYKLMKSVVSLIRDTFPRMHKLVLKGREKDPNRQIYNEKMTDRINSLFMSYCQEVLLLWFCRSVESPNNSAQSCTIEDEESYTMFVKKVKGKLAKGNCVLSTTDNAVEKQCSTNCSGESIIKHHAKESASDSQAPSSDVECSVSSFDEVAKAVESFFLAFPEEAAETFSSLEHEIPFFFYLTNTYFSCIRRRAEKEDWKRQIAASISEVTSLENFLRQLIAAEEHEHHQSLKRLHQTDRLELLLSQERKKEEKHKQELKRRKIENQLLLRKSHEWCYGKELLPSSNRPDWKNLFANLAPYISPAKCTESPTCDAESLAIEDFSSLSNSPSDKRSRIFAFPYFDGTVSQVERISPEAYKGWLKHMYELIKQVQKTPDDINIRTLRSNHPVFMKHFSHPSFVFYLFAAHKAGHCAGSSETGEKGEDLECLPVCACKFILHYTELILYAVGYRLRYDNWEDSFNKRALASSSGIPISRLIDSGNDGGAKDEGYSFANRVKCSSCISTFINFADLPLPQDESGFHYDTSVSSITCEEAAGISVAILPDFYFPCGRLASAHEYKPQGFEPYGERIYHLMEPNPEEEPDAWMTWFTILDELQSSLVDLISEKKK